MHSFSKHEPDGCEAQERSSLTVQALPVLGQPPASTELRKGALHDPPPRQDHEAFRGVGSLDDLHVHASDDLFTALRNLRP